MSPLSPVQALTFDVFGTVVDWRSAILRAGEKRQGSLARPANWEQFADAWRSRCRPLMETIRQGALPFRPLAQLQRQVLLELLAEFDLLGGWSEAEIDDFNQVWQRLEPWPDVIGGLQRLRARFLLATLSNGNAALLIRMAKNAALPWDAILSAEFAGTYKPAPAVYRCAADWLGLPPDRVMMVAAHPYDLQAARAAGFRTAYVPRPLEYGPGRLPEPAEGSAFDVVARDFPELADRLGA